MSSDENADDMSGKDTITSAVIGNVVMKLVMIFVLVGLCIEMAGHATFVIGYRFITKKNFMFLTGTLYAFSGLSSFAGIIIFMGNVTAESGNQPEVPKDKVAIFRYRYGMSFVCLAISFCLIEVAGITAVYLFIIRYKHTYKRHHAKRYVLKSNSELLHDYLQKKRRTSYTPEHSMVGSRRASHISHISYQHSNGLQLLPVPSVSSFDHLSDNGMIKVLYSPRRRFSRRKSSLVALAAYPEVSDNPEDEHQSTYCNGDIIDNEAIMPPPPSFNEAIQRKVTTSV